MTNNLSHYLAAATQHLEAFLRQPASPERPQTLGTAALEDLSRALEELRLAEAESLRNLAPQSGELGESAPEEDDDTLESIAAYIAPSLRARKQWELESLRRKRTEQILRQSEAQYRSLFAHMLNGFAYCKMLFDDQGHAEDFIYIDVNNSYERLTGLKNVVGKRVSEIIPGIRDAHPELLEKYGRVAATGEPTTFEIYFSPLDSWFSISTFSTEQGYFVTTFDNITARKKQEEELHRLNQTLRAISNHCRALMRATDEASYLKDVCNIIVEDCGRAMVWIGYAEDDENLTVRPVASAGFEGGYLNTLHITWADTERGRGPTGTAVRTGNVSICRDMHTDPNFSPWRQNALARGYAACIGLPLRQNDKTIGVLTIYAQEADPFSDEEIRLLSELADNLAYGITAIRLRQSQAVATPCVNE